MQAGSGDGRNASAVLYFSALHFPLSLGREGGLCLTWSSSVRWEDIGGAFCIQSNLLCVGGPRRALESLSWYLDIIEA